MAHGCVAGVGLAPLSRQRAHPEPLPRTVGNYTNELLTPSPGDKVNGIVIRPAVLYGRSGSMLEPFLLAPAYDAAKSSGTFDVIGLNDTRLLMVHQDDLADLYLRAGERVSANVR